MYSATLFPDAQYKTVHKYTYLVERVVNSFETLSDSDDIMLFLDSPAIYFPYAGDALNALSIHRRQLLDMDLHQLGIETCKNSVLVELYDCCGDMTYLFLVGNALYPGLFLQKQLNDIVLKIKAEYKFLNKNEKRAPEKVSSFLNSLPHMCWLIIAYKSESAPAATEDDGFLFSTHAQIAMSDAETDTENLIQLESVAINTENIVEDKVDLI